MMWCGVLPRLWAAALMGTVAGTAAAAQVSIQASFTPSALEPARNEFTNDTPNGGLCVRPNLCGPGEKSVLLPMTVRYAEMQPFAGADHEARISVPSAWQRVVLTHADSGRTAETEWRVSFLGSTYYLTRDARETTGNDNVSQAHHRLWQGNGWSEPPPGCGRMNYAEAGGTSWRFGWRYPESATTCVKRPRYLIDEGMTLREISLGYTMRSPNPLAMESGVYTGHLRLRVGPGGDFDFGTNTVASDNELTVHFTLTVTHAFQVTFPQASPKVSLAPVGGWSQWTRHGVQPARLQQELPFLLTTSNEFSVKMRCQHDSGSGCGIANVGTGAVVPVAVDVTLPGMRDVRSGASAQNVPLASERSGQVAPRFRPQSYLQNRPSRLRFAAIGPSVAEMLKAPGSRWQGDVTVVFDSEP